MKAEKDRRKAGWKKEGRRENGREGGREKGRQAGKERKRHLLSLRTANEQFGFPTVICPWSTSIPAGGND